MQLLRDDRRDYLSESLVCVLAHFVVGPVLDGMRRKDPRSIRKTQGVGLGHGSLDELGRRNEDAGDAPAFEINDVVHTARRTTASIGECLDDQRALGGDLLAQVDRRRFGERWLLEAQHLRAGLGEELLKLIEEHVAARLADVQQAHDLAAQR